MADIEHHRSFADWAYQALSNVGQDDRVKQAAAVAREAAEGAEGASKTVTRKGFATLTDLNDSQGS